MLPYNKKLTPAAQQLRKNMTPEEKHLWYDFLKKISFNVKRQAHIENYIVDFYIPAAKLVIELDGIQHNMTENRAADQKRDMALRQWGILVLRYSNNDIHSHFEAVCSDITKHLHTRIIR